LNWEKTLLLVASILLVTVMMYSGYRLVEINYHRSNEQELHGMLLAYRPTLQPVTVALAHEPDNEEYIPWGSITPPGSTVINPTIVQLQETHPSVVGWMTIPNTRIDHPFVQRPDNVFYLDHDINHERSPSGTVFMDYRNLPDFTEFHTLVYGHNMRNGSMFGTLREFLSRDFFIANRDGFVFLPYATYEFDVFAVAIIRPDDGIIYGLQVETVEQRQEFIDHVRRVSTHIRPYMDPTPDDRFITLSTCRNDAANSRVVLIGVIRE